VLLESAELILDIDVDRAEAARQRAEDRLRSRDASVDVARAEAALARSLNRIHLAKKK
jgi:F-type H+-transporting ATPase subunit epsilon